MTARLRGCSRFQLVIQDAGRTTEPQKRSHTDNGERRCRIKGVRIDPCCLDVFTCAVAQARNPKLPAAQRKWWYWSRVRKAGNQPR